jgi:UDP-GlcNAc:undecaprenyl-phosphate GlcNAc-1-phosphate transferase
LTDTIAAVLRRTLHKRSISAKDKSHLHHRLLLLGFTHRQTVLVIYALAIIFSLTAILFPISSFWGTMVLVVGLIYGVVLFIASFNLLDSNRSKLRKMLYRLLREKDEKNK